ncbi:Uncharacterised protein [uncultured archaeon]|nr:Uncharacterised protein [uncultured archaeon]
MRPLQKLDKLVKNELKGIKKPAGFNVRFRSSDKAGDGQFTVQTRVDDISIKYECEKDGVELTLKCRGERLFISADESTVYHVSVNEQEYYQSFNDEEDESWRDHDEKGRERLNALARGGKCLKEVQDYLKGAVPDLIRLMESYFSRKLMPLDDLMPAHSNEKVFEMFDLRRKLNKPHIENSLYGRAKA